MSLLDGLVSWWDLEEASGTRYDAHGSNHLTDVNTVGSGAGVVGNAAVFVRTNAEYLSCVSDAFGLGASEWTLDFWMRIDDDGFADPRQLCIVADGNLALQMFYVVGQRAVLDVFSDSGTRYRATLGSALPHGEWLHVTLMRSGGQVSITVEGVGSASANMPAGTPIRGGSSHELRLGDGGDGKRMNGAMDSVGIWSRALNGSEVLALYNGGAGRSYADLAGGGGEYTLTAEAGTFALTGQSATLSAGQVIAAETGTLTLTGQSAGLRAARHLTAEQGTFTATGQTSDLLRTYRIAADPGTLAATGQAAALVYTPASGAYTLAAEPGAFTATGQDAALTAARRIAATTGTYALTGQAATLAHGLTLTAEPGTLALAGQAATLTRTRIMAAETGAFTLSGQAAALTWSGRPVPTVPAERTYVVPFESRAFTVPFENRTLTA